MKATIKKYTFNLPQNYMLRLAKVAEGRGYPSNMTTELIKAIMQYLEREENVGKKNS